MRGPELSVSLGKEINYKGNRIIVMKDWVERRKKPDNTDIHEATHGYLARVRGVGVRNMENRGDGVNTLGSTETDRSDIVAAVGPEADGLSGTGHDLRIAAILGNVESAKATAKSIINNSREEIYEVASALAEKGTMNGDEIDDAIENSRKKKKGEATLTIINPDGTERTKKVDLLEETVMVPGEWIQLPRTA